MKKVNGIYAIKKAGIVDYVNMFLLLCLSGVSFFTGSSAFLVAVFGINALKFVIEKRKLDKEFLYVIFFLFTLSIIQVLWFGTGSLVTYGGFFLKVSTAYLAIKNIDEFIEVYVRVLLFLSVVSLILFFGFTVFHSLEDTLYSMRNVWDNPMSEQDKDLIIYNIHREETFGVIERDNFGLFGLTRNAGPFWEPGAFGGYLTLGIIFAYLTPSKWKKLRLSIFIFALFTTFSTTAYLAVLVFFILNSAFVNNKNKTLLIALPFMLVAGFFIVMNVDFIGAKIFKQFDNFKDNRKYAAAGDDDSRLGSALLDYDDFKRSPIFGTGPSNETRYSPREQLFIRTNGVTDLLVRIGPIGFVAFFIMLTWSLKNFFRRVGIEKFRAAALVCVALIVIISFSEAYFNQVFFWSLLFLPHNIMD